MSGIVGIVHTDGAPVDRPLLVALTAALAERGPDGQSIWAEDGVGLGHALLGTTAEAAIEQQPLSLDGTVWLTADLRLDGRAELVQQLRGQGRVVGEALPDPVLLLHAYQAWGEDCVHHLLGDFAFALWDGPRRRLFCARDHLGVKPFFYADRGNCLLFGNTLACLRLHPAVSRRLNETAVGDFLLFGANQDPATSIFTDIQRLPAAHTLTWTPEHLRLRRYWQLPQEGEVRYRHARDYVEHFQFLLAGAVADRLRAAPSRPAVGLCLSGGLDSAAVAASACGLAREGGALHLHAFTVYFEELIPDEEGVFAGQVARHLDLPITCLPADGHRLYDGLGEEGPLPPEPSNDPLATIGRDHFRQLASHARVALTGEGGDPAFLGSATYALDLLKRGQLGALAVDFVRCLALGRLPKVGLRARLRRWLGRGWTSPYPSWLDPDFEARTELRARWRDFQAPAPPGHPRRPEAYAALSSPHWPAVFESMDPAVTGQCLEVRHPLLDVRLLRFALAIPALPWCDNKELLRQALRGRVPEVVRRRPKAPLQDDPVRLCLERGQCGWAAVPVGSELDRFVDLRRLPVLAALAAARDPERFVLDAGPYCLSDWLRRLVGCAPPSRQVQVAPAAG